MTLKFVSLAIVAAAVLVATTSESMASRHHHDKDKHHHKGKHHGKRHHHKHKGSGGKTVDVVDDQPGGEMVSCITDCACVQDNCPVGDHSCGACWMYENTNVACSPGDDEQATYGFSCPAR